MSSLFSRSCTKQSASELNVSIEFIRTSRLRLASLRGRGIFDFQPPLAVPTFIWKVFPLCDDPLVSELAGVTNNDASRDDLDVIVNSIPALTFARKSARISLRSTSGCLRTSVPGTPIDRRRRVTLRDRNHASAADRSSASPSCRRRSPPRRAGTTWPSFFV